VEKGGIRKRGGGKRKGGLTEPMRMKKVSDSQAGKKGGKGKKQRRKRGVKKPHWLRKEGGTLRGTV